MNVTTNPKLFGSAFRPACYGLAGVQPPAAGGVDIEIRSYGTDEVLGVKRLYTSGTASINVAPYARRFLSPRPMCDRAQGLFIAPDRAYFCYLVSEGFISDPVALCAGVEDAPTDVIASLAPADVRIAPGEKDEIPILSGDWITPEIIFHRAGTTYTDTSMGRRNVLGMVAAVIDPEAVCGIYAARTGGAASELTEFSVRLRLSASGFENEIVERRYTIDRTARTGRRLAWINRFGAIDYYTFPQAAEFRSTGSRSSVETPAGRLTVGTDARQSLKLLSEPCDAVTAGWLSEIFSSPEVWMVEGASFEKVDIADGGVVASPLKPSVVEVVVSPRAAGVSRKS